MTSERTFICGNEVPDDYCIQQGYNPANPTQDRLDDDFLLKEKFLQKDDKFLKRTVCKIKISIEFSSRFKEQECSPNCADDTEETCGKTEVKT